MVALGATLPEARSKIFLIDSQGLVATARASIPHHKRNYAKDLAHPLPNQHHPTASAGASTPASSSSCLLNPEAPLRELIRAIRPTALIGVSAQPGAFSEAVLAEMADINARPIVFALSNPTSKAECSAEAAIHATQGRCLFCSGSPFNSFVYAGDPKP
jgi:malate dehydrogenase (oxaloacetate-decarboxylating)(NADP+)